MTRFGKSGHHRDWYLRFTSKEDRTKSEVESPDEAWVSRPWTGIDGEVAWQTPDGKLHRIGAPAALRHDGTEEWWERGERHRIDGPATTHPSGYEAWYVNGVRHRVDGPAFSWPDGHQEWFQNGVRHRVDGPARTYSDGTLEWWEHGERKPPEVEEMLTMLWRSARTP